MAIRYTEPKPRKENGIYITWRVDDQYPDGDKRRRTKRSLDTRDVKEALKKWHALQLGAAQDVPPETMTVLECLRQYTNWKVHKLGFDGEPRRVKKDEGPYASASTLLSIVRKVLDKIPRMTLAQFTPTAQKQLCEHFGNTTSTEARYMGIVQSAIRFMREHEKIKSVPQFMKLPKVSRTEQMKRAKKPYSVEQLRALCAAAETEAQRRWLLLYISTMTRPGSILELTWDRICKDTKTVDYNVPGRVTTNKRRIIAPLAESAARYLEERRSTGLVVRYDKSEACAGVGYDDFKSMWVRLGARAKVPYKGSHSAYSIRKGVGTYLRSRGISKWDVETMLAHEDAGSDTYAHNDPSYMIATRTAVEILLKEINPPWLFSSAGTKPEPVETAQNSQVVDFVGAHAPIRTGDTHHVNVPELQGNQQLSLFPGC